METKRKTLKLFVWVVAIIFAISAGLSIPALAEANYKWSRLGRAPLMPELEDKISLQEQFSLYKKEIIDGLKMAEPGWDASRVFETSEAIIRSDAKVEEVVFSKGQNFLWMIFKGKKGVSVLKEVEWVGKEPLKGFLYSCIYDGLELKFFLAKKCGNVALLGKKILPPPKAEAPPPAPPPKVETPPRYVEPLQPLPEYQPRVYVDIYPPPPPLPPPVYGYDYYLPLPLPPPFFGIYYDSYYRHYGRHYEHYRHYGGSRYGGYRGHYDGYRHYRPSPPRHYSPRYHQPRHFTSPRTHRPGVRTR